MGMDKDLNNFLRHVNNNRDRLRLEKLLKIKTTSTVFTGSTDRDSSISIKDAIIKLAEQVEALQ